MTLLHDRPYRIANRSPETRRPHPVVIPLPKALGDIRLPQGMNAFLACELAVVVGGGMQGHMGISQVMTYFGGESEDAGGLLGSEGFHELPKGLFQVPGEDSMSQEGVFAETLYGFAPGTGQVRGVPVQVYVMAGRFPGKGGAPFVGLGGLASEVFDMGPVKGKERFRQGKNRQAIDAPMRPETPTVCQKG